MGNAEKQSSEWQSVNQKYQERGKREVNRTRAANCNCCTHSDSARSLASVQNSPNSNGIPKTELQFIFTTDRASCDTNHRIDARAAPLRPVPVPLQLSHKCSCRNLLYISRHSLSLFLQTMAMKFPTPILDHLSPQILQNGMHAFVPNCFRHKGAT